MTYRAVGTDTSGRPIRMSPVFTDWWDLYVDRLGFVPTITQGGWMGDLAAALSSTTHDGDALDLRVWDRTQNQVQAMVREARALGAAAWLRDQRHGGFTDPHVHLVPGRWAHPSASALRQWDACRNGRDGLASNGPDYHPYPLATTPPKDDLMAAADDILKAIDAQTKAINAHTDKRVAELKNRIDISRNRIREVLGSKTSKLDANDRAILEAILADDDA
ncbi:hypothetical protein [Nocardioides sp. J54]|uniref:hypothetical protein n=1 Tax=Nocardioides sp. J54 TaxID=935866 RepID=UPI00048C23A4|nr:hypothetical protein [Nocardioides sp. J54]